MGIAPRSKNIAAIIMAVCILSASCVATIHVLNNDHRPDTIDSVIFDMYEDDRMVHFDFEEDYLFNRYLAQSSTDQHSLGMYLSEFVTAGRVPTMTDFSY